MSKWPLGPRRCLELSSDLSDLLNFETQWSGMEKALSRGHGLLEIPQLLRATHVETKVQTAILHPAPRREGTACSETRHSSHIINHRWIKARLLDADRLDDIETTVVVKHLCQPGSTILWAEQRPLRSLQSAAHIHSQ